MEAMIAFSSDWRSRQNALLESERPRLRIRPLRRLPIAFGLCTDLAAVLVGVGFQEAGPSPHGGITCTFTFLAGSGTSSLESSATGLCSSPSSTKPIPERAVSSAVSPSARPFGAHRSPTNAPCIVYASCPVFRT
ncbi:hypothetical protein FDG2_3391 [Candidatus Protofrankia californiensis]|uniref:Uncharacterized protein n=1 Tax=Candidatus Protofrankia californiensis TaxID=1839754 RepID=A0A1C3NZJ1_9ACTN|nr:hypothetical protein FDG2_3391 [Candidatus Protofrankia californiensis]